MTDYPTLLRSVWPLFREAVRMRRTLTYTELAGRAGPPLQHRFLHRQLLNDLSDGCRRCGLPDLCALVVRQDTGMPGAGWFAANPSDDPDGTWAEAVARCHEHPWPARVPACLRKVVEDPRD